ncbi:hypothetical protein BGX24_001714 [Mortierella sp. AD032]|nr:hypothetical protein BGX24_001714 [Mortierella sp. AD032]
MDALDSLVSLTGVQDSTVAHAPLRPQDAAAAAPQEPVHIIAQSLSPQVSAQALPPPSPPAPAAGAGHEPGPPGSGTNSADAKPQQPLHPGTGAGTPSPRPPATRSTSAGAAPSRPSAQPSISVAIPTTTLSTPAPERTPGPAINLLPPGTNNCLTEPFCSVGEECFVLSDGLVCLPKTQNWGYILSRNASGIPSVPSWSGPYSQLSDNCTQFQMPASGDKPGLALLVYDLIRDTLPKDLLLSRFDKSTTNWYTHFSNCDPSLTCSMGICQPRPALNESCTSSWQCNALALGLDEFNNPIPTANTTEMRCEYLDGDKSVNTTCQLLYREEAAVRAFEEDDGWFSAWHVIVPVVIILILIYFGTVAYQRRMRLEQRRKWTRSIEDDFHMEAYDEIH